MIKHSQNTSMKSQAIKIEPLNIQKQGFKHIKDISTNSFLQYVHVLFLYISNSITSKQTCY